MHHIVSQLVVILNSFLTEMGEIIRTTTKRGGWTLDGILIDGIFKHCPTFFMQLYSVCQFPMWYQGSGVVLDCIGF